MTRQRRQAEIDYREALRILATEALSSNKSNSLSEISVASVATKAGRGRTQIAHTNAPYSNIRRLIFRVKRRILFCKSKQHTAALGKLGAAQGQKLEIVNGNLRRRIAELESEVAMFSKLLVEADLQLSKFNGRTEREQFDLDRKANRSNRRPPR